LSQSSSLLFDEGRNVKQVQRWLGHHSPAFTLDTYVHLLDDGVGEPLDLPAVVAVSVEEGLADLTNAEQEPASVGN
jgi:integrase